MADQIYFDNFTFGELFDRYVEVDSTLQIKRYFDLMCAKLAIRSHEYYADTSKSQFLYQLFQSKTNYSKSDDLFAVFDNKRAIVDYDNVPKTSLKVLIVGSGPVGLRLSIELAMLGLNVVVIEKRDRFSRNNVLRLWPYVSVDLGNIGARQFYDKPWPKELAKISMF
jgi:hypothetical protein